MKTIKNLKKRNKIIYTALGTITLGVIGVFSMLVNNTKLENWILGNKLKIAGGLDVIDSSETFITDFDCTKNIQTYTAQYSGKYKLQVWGAQGGTTQGYTGGYGGYSYGETKLNEGEEIYVGVGGAGVGATGQGQSLAGGYNGGGSVTGNPGVNHFTASRRWSNSYC